MNIPLNAYHIFHLAKKECNVFGTTDLVDYEYIGELFNPQPQITKYPFDNNFILINYLSSPNFGHWTCLYRIDNIYYFFDSYGEMIDEQLKYIPKDFRISSDQTRARIAEMIVNAMDDNPDIEIHYNNVKLQGNSPDSMVCGRYCAYMLKHSNKPVEKNVSDIVRNSEKLWMTPDSYITFYFNE